MAELLALYLRHAERETCSEPVALPLWPQVENALLLIQKRYSDPARGLSEMAAAAEPSCSHFSSISGAIRGYRHTIISTPAH